MNEANPGFWAELKKRADEQGRPIMAMAPMANVTDAAFRRMFAAVGDAAAASGGGNASGVSGKPDVFWTEFVSVEGLLSAGREQLLVDFWKSPAERPIVAQIFGGKPEQFEEVAKLVRELGFDGIDLNMGCPDGGVEKSGGGASLIRHPELAREIIRATKRGAGWNDAPGADNNSGDGRPALPVSVKTRLGYLRTDEMTAWLTTILEENVAALTVHLRTRKEMSLVPAHWELAHNIVELRDRIVGRPTPAKPSTLILGNGDVATLEEARARVAESGMDGIMVGRGMFGNPWFFDAKLGGQAPNIKEKLMRMVEHTELFEKLYRSDAPRDTRKNPVPFESRPLKNFEVMKKHFKAYCSGFDDAKELRIKLMETEHAAEVRKIVETFILSI